MHSSEKEACNHALKPKGRLQINKKTHATEVKNSGNWPPSKKQPQNLGGGGQEIHMFKKKMMLKSQEN